MDNHQDNKKRAANMPRRGEGGEITKKQKIGDSAAWQGRVF
jgi:hypothetical protein